MLKKFIFSFFLVFSCSVSYGQWKSFYPENNQSKSNTKEKKDYANFIEKYQNYLLVLLVIFLITFILIIVSV